MSLFNEINEIKNINEMELKTYLILLNPFAPHITEEIWSICNFGGSVTDQKWPAYDENKCKDSMAEIVIQVNGKIKARLRVDVNISKEEVMKLANDNDSVKQAINGKNIRKEIYVPGKLLNIVV